MNLRAVFSRRKWKRSFSCGLKDKQTEDERLSYLKVSRCKQATAKTCITRYSEQTIEPNIVPSRRTSTAKHRSAIDPSQAMRSTQPDALEAFGTQLRAHHHSSPRQLPDRANDRSKFEFQSKLLRLTRPHNLRWRCVYFRQTFHCYFRVSVACPKLRSFNYEFLHVPRLRFSRLFIPDYSFLTNCRSMSNVFTKDGDGVHLIILTILSLHPIRIDDPYRHCAVGVFLFWSEG